MENIKIKEGSKKIVRFFKKTLVEGCYYHIPLFTDLKIWKRNGKLLQEAPSVNGHYWVDKDDVGIIDPDFPEFEAHVRKKFGAIRMTDKIYVEADEQTQQDAIRMTENITFNPALACRFLECPRNARKDQANYGGRIVFGSVGFKQEDGTIKWVYGGKNWKTEQFFDCNAERGLYPVSCFAEMEPMAKAVEPERKKRKC